MITFKEVVVALRTMGKRPSFSSPPAREHPPVRSAGLSPLQIGRIETKIFQGDQMLDEVDDISPVTDEEIERFLAGTADVEALPQDAGSTPAGTRIKGRVLAAALAGCLVLTAISVASSRSAPGSILYPAKLQWEVVRLALADGKLGEAQVHMEVAANRLEALKDRPNLRSSARLSLLNEMEVSTLAAWDLISTAQPSRLRTAAAGQLLGLTREQIRTVRSLSSRIGPTEAPLFTAFIETASRIGAEIAGLLFPSKIASAASIQLHGGRAAAAKRPTRRGAVDTPQASRMRDVTNTQSPRNGDEPTVPGSDCAVSQGTVCVTVPGVIGALPLP